MTEGSDQLKEIIAQIRAVGQLGEIAAPDVALAIRAELRRSIAAGQTPDGEPWKLTAEGAKPLKNAAANLTVGAYKGTIFVTLKGVEARHHSGRVRGGIKRQVIPDRQSAGVPARMAAEIRVVLDRHFREVTSG